MDYAENGKHILISQSCRRLVQKGEGNESQRWNVHLRASLWLVLPAMSRPETHSCEKDPSQRSKKLKHLLNKEQSGEARRFWDFQNLREHSRFCKDLSWHSLLSLAWGLYGVAIWLQIWQLDARLYPLWDVFLKKTIWRWITQCKTINKRVICI